jgi:hypothetical protein
MLRGLRRSKPGSEGAARSGVDGTDAGLEAPEPQKNPLRSVLMNGF